MDLDFEFEDLALLDMAASLALLAVLFAARHLAIRFIKNKTDAAPHLQRRWAAGIRNLFLFLALIGLALIWAPQLRTVALSLTAVAVAVVVATKELILCFSGSFMRASSRAFAVGDWIEVAGVRGEVIDHDIFVTTLQEFDSPPHSFRPTGRTAVVPNSAFFGSPIRNYTSQREYVFHTFSVTVEPAINVFDNRQLIESIVQKHYAPHQERASRSHAVIERGSGIDLSDALVRLRFSTTDLGKYRISITLFCPTPLTEVLENEIVCDLMSTLHRMAKEPLPEEQAGSTPDDQTRRV
jgi:small-conductance mechanosensitive channel